MALFSFDTTNVAPQETISPIPAGVYTAQCVESDVRPLKSGQGRALALTFQVLDGQYAGRKVFANLNVEHRGSAEAERIAQSQLSALCHAIGMPRGVQRDTSELHMKPVRIRVKVRKDETGQYGDRNEVTGYEAAPGGAAPAMAAQQPAAQQGAAGSPPWARRQAA